MPRKTFPPSRAPQFRFADTLAEQERQLASNPLMRRMDAARRAKADDPWRPLYHYVNPENTLNDPNGLCFWQGRWHLFYQAVPPEETRQHWGHAVSEDLVHWRDLPYALHPGPEDRCYSGTTLVEEERVVAIYHGVRYGNMVATARDPLLLNWEKLPGNPVIPFAGADEAPPPYGVFDPCIWSSDGAYYALAGGIIPGRPEGKYSATDYLFRSRDLVDWEYLHPFIEGDRFTVPGDDGACPYFWPIGDRHILLFFSHMSGGQYWLGDYDRQRQKFVVDAHGRCNFGATFPAGVHAPTAAPDGEGGVIVMFNMNPGKPTYRMNDYLGDFFGDQGGGGTDDDPGQAGRHWDQILTLPRRLTLRNPHELTIEPAGDIEALRHDHRHIGPGVLPANQELLLDDIRGNAIELQITFDPKLASMVEVDVLRSPQREECTRICFFNKRGFRYREPHADDPHAHRVMSTMLSNPVRHESIITIDTSLSSTLPDALSRPPESAPVFIEPGEPVRLRIFVDRSIVEVFVNDRQCLALRVYPGRADSTGVSLLSRGQDAELLALDCWQMRSVYDPA
ncbi:MAG: glycoside hydrolase family 32 protein [Anaerolineaceae bacterium]|nr:glycoside hydrolase family 32 protein [Anaerolineaceae bacterium]